MSVALDYEMPEDDFIQRLKELLPTDEIQRLKHVAVLLVEGLEVEEIAERLQIHRRTVERKIFLLRAIVAAY